MSIQVRSPLKWIGGKSADAERILAAFPPANVYNTYVEPFGGAGHVLFAKDPYRHEEVYNDLGNNLYAFFSQLRDNADELQARVDDLLYSRAQYREWYPTLFDGTKLDPFERAVRFFYCLQLIPTGHLRKSPVGINCKHSNVHAFRSATELFPILKQRLRYVLVDNRDCIETIERYDSPKTLLYCDPPYLNKEHYYEASKDGFDHVALAQALNAAKGFVALSYYPHPLLNQLYPPDKWRRMTWTQKKSSSLKARKDGEIHPDMAEELLLMNYFPTVGGLFDERTNA